MSLFQIWTTHNRPWSVREIIVFLIILSVCSFFIFRAVRRKRLKLRKRFITNRIVKLQLL